MKRILISVLILLIPSIMLFGCEKNREYDEETVKAFAKELIIKSEELNKIYWGEGIGYITDLGTSNGYYYEADPFYLKKYGVETVEDIREKTRKVFSLSYCENIFATKLSSIYDEDNIYSYARYYQKYSDAENKIPEAIMVYSRALVLLTDEVEYLTDTVTVEGSKGEIVYVNISVNVKREEKIQRRTIKIGLIEEEDGWRIDTPTYISYDEEQNAQ